MVTPPSSLSGEALKQRLAGLRAHFQSGATRSLEWRMARLAALAEMIRKHRDNFEQALQEDLGKCPTEAWITEVGFSLNEVKHAQKNLSRWLKPEKVSTPWVNLPGSSRVQREPFGVTLIIAPWNYPFQLSLAPLVGALAAGNTAMLKPSELAPHTSAELARRIPEFLDAEAVTVVEGGVDVTQELLAERFDMIFFTGSTRIGKIVMQAAAQHLTPVVLELGGANPCIVEPDVDIQVAARRIAWGKFLNAGQTCVAPNYVLVHKSVEQALLDGLAQSIQAFYEGQPLVNEQYGRIVNEANFDRLLDLLKKHPPTFGGNHERSALKIEPSICAHTPSDSPLCHEEIFGPILPVCSYESFDEALSVVQQGEHPLVHYIFSHDKQKQERLFQASNAGAVCVNDTIAYLGVPDLPFGGVGASGVGSYHGVNSFEAFSHPKALHKRTLWPDISVRYPPYTPLSDKMLRFLV